MLTINQLLTMKITRDDRMLCGSLLASDVVANCSLRYLHFSADPLSVILCVNRATSRTCSVRPISTRKFRAAEQKQFVIIAWFAWSRVTYIYIC